MSQRDDLLGRITGITLDEDGGPELAVLALLECRKKKNGDRGPVLPTLENAILVLERDSRWKDRVWGNEMDGSIYIVLEDGSSVMLSDEHEVGIYRWIVQRYEFHMTTQKVHEAVKYIATQNKRHPLRERLRSLEWDKTPRLREWLHVYCKASADPLIGEIGLCWAVSAVARAMVPGCKVDTALIFKSRQGAVKSTAFKALALDDEWFSDTDIDMRSKDKYESLQGIWIYELAELSSVRKADQNAVKAFISSQRDRFRPAYGRNTVKWGRQNVFVGTTNEEAFLNDPTGSRRFWPVRVGDIDITALRRDREQLWAEAVTLYDAGRQWWLSKEDDVRLAEMSSQFQHSDPWELTIERWAKKREALGSPFTLDDVLTGAMGHNIADCNNGHELRAKSVLTVLGYEQKRCRVGGDRARWWWRGEYKGKPW